MRVGEIYRVRTDSAYCEGQSMHSRPRVKGRVVWVHPKGRFALLDLGGAQGVLLSGAADEPQQSETMSAVCAVAPVERYRCFVRDCGHRGGWKKWQ